MTTTETKLYYRTKPRTAGRLKGTTGFLGVGIVEAARGARYDGLHLSVSGYVNPGSNGNVITVATFLADALAEHLEANGWKRETPDATHGGQN